MKTLAVLFVVLPLVGGALLTACPSGQPPIPPPIVDASDAAATPGCQAACSALSAAGCALGAQPGCGLFLDHMQADGKEANAATRKPLTCADVAGVKTKADAVRLGFACP